MIKLYFTFILIISPAFSQISQQWVARYNGPTNNNEISVSVKVDNSGDIYIAGNLIESLSSDYLLLKYNTNGSLLWSKRYNGTGNSNDYVRSLEIDNSGNVILTGSSIGVGSSLEDCVTLKYDSEGNLLWTQRYNGGAGDEGTSVTTDDAGNIYVCGFKQLSSVNPDFLIIKYQPNGTIAWLQTYNSASNNQDYANDIVVDASGNVFVTGCSYLSPDMDYLTIKYSSDGIVQWLKRYHGGVSDDFANALALDQDGNIYVTGKSRGTGTNFDIVTNKYTNGGSFLWSKRSNGSSNSNDEGTDITVDNFGNILACGYLSSLFTNENMAVVKYDSTGNILWTYTYTGQGGRIDIAEHLTTDTEGNIYITGTSDSNSIGNVVTFRLDPDGNEQWLHNYNGPANNDDDATSLAVDAGGNVYITCTSIGIGTAYDIVTIKNSQTIGIINISGNIPTGFSLGQNFPNPFNPVTKFRFSVKKNSDVKIEMFDAKGSSAGILVNEHLSAGMYETDVNAGLLSSGIYFYRMTAGDFTETKKMIIIK